MRRLRGSVSQRRFIFIADTSSTTGAGLANLTHSSSGLVAYYIAGDLSNEVQITLVSGTLGTYVSGGFVAVDNTNMPGWYEVGIPDAALDGGNQVAIQYRGATNMAPVNIYIDLDAVDYQTDAFGALKPTTAGRTLDVTATGAAGIDLANVENQGSTLNLSATSIKTATDVETDTQDIQTRLPSGLVDGRIAAIAQVVGDKTGYKLASDGLSLVTAWAVAITGNITGNLSGSVGSINGVTFPANFGALGIDPSGHVSRVVLVDTTTTNTDMRGTNGAALASNWTATRAGYLDLVLLANNTNQRTINITGNGHVPSVLHDAEPNSIPEDAFVTGSISARAIGTDAIDSDALASSANTEIANAVGQLTAIVDLGTMIINDGTANARYSVSALQNGPSGAGGSTINVYPVSASTPERVAGTTITYYRDENRAVSVVTDFVLDALTLEFVIEDSEGTDLLVIPDGSISKSNKTFTVTIGTTVTATISNYRWSLRDVTSGSNSVIARGVLSVQEAASNG